MMLQLLQTKFTTLHGNPAKTTPPHINSSETHQDNRIILFLGSKPEDQHTRRIQETLSSVYKPGDYLCLLGTAPHAGCSSFTTAPTKTLGVRHTFLRWMRFGHQLCWASSPR